MSLRFPFASIALKFVAFVSKAIRFVSEDMLGKEEASSAWAPAVLLEMRIVEDFSMSLRKMSLFDPFRSFEGSRFVAEDAKRTSFPSPEITVNTLSPLPSPPAGETLTSFVDD